MTRGYRLRVYPSPRQRRQLAREFGAGRFVWNLALKEISTAWKERQESLSILTLSRRVTEMKHSSHPWLRSTSSTVVTQSLRDLQRAFQNFFEKRARYPRRKKRRAPQAARYQLDPRQKGTWIPGKRLVLPLLGPLQIVWSRIPLGRPLMVTVRRDARDRYFVCFSVDEVISPIPKAPNVAI